MSEGRKPDAETRHSLPVDCRLLEVLEDYPRVIVPVWRRPWIGDQMLLFDGYPVEYRAFVESGNLIGISSYYPQRPLPGNDEHLAVIEEHVAALLDELEPPFEWPAMASEQMRVNAMRAAPDGGKAPTGGPLQDEIHFTADFAATRLGMVLLEGGPPDFMGAAPCCFAAGRIDGVALEAQEDEHAPSEHPT